jgi:excisionase family DNA binding protein
MITLGNAARQLGLSKPTLSKAISRGHLSATRREDGSFAIDPSELARWYEGARHRFHQQRGANTDQRLQPSTGGADAANGNADGADGADDIHLRFARLEVMEVELAGLQQLLAAERKRAEEIRAERDDWKDQAKRLALAPPPIVTPAPVQAPAPADAGGPLYRVLRWMRKTG